MLLWADDKTDTEIPRCDVVVPAVAVATRDTAIGGGSTATTAAQDGVGARSLRVVNRVFGVRAIGVGDKLPDVARHVKNTEFVVHLGAAGNGLVA